MDKFLGTIKSFGRVYYSSHSFRECPKNMKETRKYIIDGSNKNILIKIGNDGWMGTICENGLDKSIEEHKCKIKILKTFDKSIMVGVATSDFDILSSQYSTWDGIIIVIIQHFIQVLLLIIEVQIQI